MSDLKSKEFKTSIDYTHHDSTTRKECTLVLFDDDVNVIPNNTTKSPNDVIENQNDVNDLISRADAIEAVWKEYEDAINIGDNGDAIADDVGRILSALPSADRPQGEWIFRTDIPIGGGRTSAGYVCSICGKDYFHGDMLDYCPNCGARMRGAE